jgi:dCMP deaminase
MVKDHCKRTAHAEMNAIAQAAANGIAIRDSCIFITHSPCLDCFKMILSCGISRIYFAESYRLDEKMLDVYRQVAGYREVDGERYYSWQITSEDKVWYKQ